MRTKILSGELDLRIITKRSRHIAAVLKKHIDEITSKRNNLRYSFLASRRNFDRTASVDRDGTYERQLAKLRKDLGEVFFSAAALLIPTRVERIMLSMSNWRYCSTRMPRLAYATCSVRADP